MRFLLISIFLTIFLNGADFSIKREQNIKNIEYVIDIYKKRLNCLKNNNAKICIERFSLSKKKDALSILIANNFPKAYYKSILKRDIKILNKEKMCWGKAMSLEDVNRCFKN